MKFLLSFLLIALFTILPTTKSIAANSNENNPQVIEISLGSITADADVYGFYLPKKSKVLGAWLVDSAGISQSDSNKAVVTLKNGSTVIATHSTAVTGGTSALTANVPAAMTLSTTASDLIVPAGTYLKVNYDETGTYGMTTAKVIVEYFPL